MQPCQRSWGPETPRGCALVKAPRSQHPRVSQNPGTRLPRIRDNKIKRLELGGTDILGEVWCRSGGRVAWEWASLGTGQALLWLFQNKGDVQNNSKNILAPE